MNIKESIRKLLSTSFKYIGFISIGIMLVSNPLLATDNFTKVSIEKITENYDLSNKIDSEIKQQFSTIKKTFKLSSNEYNVIEIIQENKSDNSYDYIIKLNNGVIKNFSSNKKINIGDKFQENYNLQQVFLTKGGFAKYNEVEGEKINISISKYIELLNNDGKVVKTINILNINNQEVQIITNGDLRIGLAQISVEQNILENILTMKNENIQLN